SSRRRHTRFSRDWSSDVCSSDLDAISKDRYPTLLADRISQALTTAFDSAVPVRIRSYSDTLIDLSFNRRFIMQDGKVRTNPGRRSEERRVGKEWRWRGWPYQLID